LAILLNVLLLLLLLRRRLQGTNVANPRLQSWMLQQLQKVHLLQLPQ
jgi:hypothetical protein